MWSISEDVIFCFECQDQTHSWRLSSDSSCPIHKPSDVSGTVGEGEGAGRLKNDCTDSYGFVYEKAGWCLNEWPIFQSDFSSVIVSLPSAQCGLISFPPALIVHDDWKDNGQGDTCNQEWFQRQEMNLWQDLFLSSVLCMSGESWTRTSVQLHACAAITLTADGKWLVLFFIVFHSDIELFCMAKLLRKMNATIEMYMVREKKNTTTVFGHLQILHYLYLRQWHTLEPVLFNW